MTRRTSVERSPLVILVGQLTAAGLCARIHRTGNHTWVCTREQHGGQHPHTDAWRRRHGVIPAIDRHWYESPEEAAKRIPRRTP